LCRELTTLFFFHCLYLKTNSAKWPPRDMLVIRACRAVTRPACMNARRVLAPRRDRAPNRILAHPYIQIKNKHNLSTMFILTACANQTKQRHFRAGQRRRRRRHRHKPTMELASWGSRGRTLPGIGRWRRITMPGNVIGECLQKEESRAARVSD
jgi:hypothetical protein